MNVLAYATDGGPVEVLRSECALVVSDERMTHDAMRERVESEAKRRAIDRVAWVEEV